MNQFQRTAINQLRSAATMLAASEPREDMEFVRLLRAIGLGRGSPIEAQRYVQPTSRAFDILEKSVVAGGGLNSPQWGNQLGAYRELSEGFAASLRATSFFDAVKPAMRVLPLRTRVGVFGTGATAGATTADGVPIPVSRMSLTGSQLEPIRVAAIILVTNELLKHGSVEVLALLQRELQAAVSVKTDAQFFTQVISGAASHASGGATATLILADLNTMLADLSLGSTSQLFLGLSQVNFDKLALKANTTGSLAFPSLGESGRIGRVTVVATDGLSTSAVLLDADGVAVGDEIFGIDAGEAASVEMLDNPTNTPLLTGSPQQPVATTQVSAFQTDSTALRCIRYFGAQRFRAASVLTSISW